jgi:hypothetical protein
MKYRIVRFGDKFIAQKRWWFLWWDMFCGYSDSPREFDTVESCEFMIKEVHDQSVQSRHASVVKSFDLL